MDYFPQHRPEVREGTATSFDGTQLWFRTVGDGPRDFLLCDGIGCDGFIWRYLEPELLRRGRIIHLHMRGHGRSEMPRDAAAVDIGHLADDCRAVLDAVGSERAVVLGHSLGVQVSLETWHRHGQRVAGLVLCCGSYENPTATFHDHRAMERLLPFLRGATRIGGRPLKQIWRRLVALPLAFHVARATEIHPDHARREDMMPYLEHLSRMDPRLFFDILRGAAAHSAGSFLADIDVPVLVVAGERDRFTPAYLSEQMCARIPAAESLVVPDGTHTAPIEHPTLVNLTITRFLDRHFPTVPAEVVAAYTS